MTPRSRRTLVTALVGVTLFGAAFGLLSLLVREGPPPGASSTLRRELVRAAVAPGAETLTVEAAGGLSLTLPPAALPAPAEVVIAAVDGAPARDLPLPHATLGVWGGRVGDQHRFAQPLVLALPYDPASLPAGLGTEFALTASY
jgi:hypothetical protein